MTFRPLKWIPLYIVLTIIFFWLPMYIIFFLLKDFMYTFKEGYERLYILLPLVSVVLYIVLDGRVVIRTDGNEKRIDCHMQDRAGYRDGFWSGNLNSLQSVYYLKFSELTKINPEYDIEKHKIAKMLRFEEGGIVFDFGNERYGLIQTRLFTKRQVEEMLLRVEDIVNEPKLIDELQSAIRDFIAHRERVLI